MLLTLDDYCGNISESLLKVQSNICDNIKQIKQSKQRLLTYNVEDKNLFYELIKEFPKLEVVTSSSIDSVIQAHKLRWFDVILLNLNKEEEEYADYIVDGITNNNILLILTNLQNAKLEDNNIQKKILKKYNGSSTWKDWFEDIKMLLGG